MIQIISYTKLFRILRERSIKKEELRKKINVSSGTFAKLGNEEPVNLKMIDSICKVLNVQPGDILEYIPDTEYQENEESSKN